MSEMNRIPMALGHRRPDRRIGLRIAMSAAYGPPILNLADSYVYLDMAANELFSDPAGLSGTRWCSAACTGSGRTST